MAARERIYDRERSATAHRQLYDSRWARAAKVHRQLHPLCRYCELDGRVAAASEVDHFWPHRGDAVQFWDARFWISTCTDCHSRMKQATEHAGHMALAALAMRLGLPQRMQG